MNEFSNIFIAGIVTCVPKNKEENIQFFKGNEDRYQDFLKRVGVKERRTSNGQLTTSDLCLKASKDLISDLKWQAEEVDILIFVSQTHDFNTPPTSNYIQYKLGLNSNTFLLDLNLGCTGWVTGLSTIISLMKTNKMKKGLLLCGETNILTSKENLSSYLLMGDAGTATAVEIDTDFESKTCFDFENFGNLYDVIISKNSKAKYIKNCENIKLQSLSLNTEMDGEKLLVFTLKQVVPIIKRFLTKINYTKESIDYFFLHQANKMFNDNIAKKLSLPSQKTPYSLNKYGNTSSASIPLTICLLGEKSFVASKNIICASFGVGLSIACLSLKLPGSFKSKIIEI